MPCGETVSSILPDIPALYYISINAGVSEEVDISTGVSSFFSTRRRHPQVEAGEVFTRVTFSTLEGKLRPTHQAKLLAVMSITSEEKKAMIRSGEPRAPQVKGHYVSLYDG